MGCADSPGCHGPTACVALEPTRLPRNFSVDSDRNASSLKLPLSTTAYSDSRNGSRGMDGLSGAREITKSHSVGIGVMGRIDEDKPCCFDQDWSYVGVRGGRGLSFIS